MSMRKEKKGDPVCSFRDLSSQTRALILYKQGDEHWYKHLGYIDYVVCREGDGILRKGFIYQTNGTHLDSVVIDDCIYPAELLRPAYTHEIAIYKQHGRPVDASAHPAKDNASTGLSGGLNEKDELLEEAKRRYPKGTKLRSAVDYFNVGISSGQLMFVLEILTCETENGGFLIVRSKDGKWAEVIEEAKEKTDVNKCIDGFDNDLFRAITGGGYLSKRGIGDSGRTFETRVFRDHAAEVGYVFSEDEGEHGLLKDENGDVMYWEPPKNNSIHVVSSRPSVIPFKEDKHIEINILKRNINI